MQIFLPFACFLLSLRALDNKRLGKQRLEALQVWMIVSGKTPDSKWKHHPVIKMWTGYEVALRDYIIKAVEVFGERKTKDGKRFFDNTCMLQWIDQYDMRLKPGEQIEYPEFIGQDTFHDSHKAMLYHKGREAVRVMAVKGKTIDNVYEHFAPYSHITRYHWPVKLKSETNKKNIDVDIKAEPVAKVKVEIVPDTKALVSPKPEIGGVSPSTTSSSTSATANVDVSHLSSTLSALQVLTADVVSQVSPDTGALEVPAVKAEKKRKRVQSSTENTKRSRRKLTFSSDSAEEGPSVGVGNKS